MLSYRHSFHAGNFADILKHLTLAYLLNYLNRKDKPYCYLDTHSGAGFYDLGSKEARKTGEFQEGVGKLHSQPLQHPLLKDFKKLLEETTGGSQSIYPGSPALASKLLRPTDRLRLNELHPRDHQLLEETFQQDRRCQVSQEDAFQFLKASLPPKEKRGVILIDPSYEKKEDYKKLITALEGAVKRFATGVYAIWYPVINRQDTEAWINKLAATGIPKMLRVEHCPYPDTSGIGMTGSGMIIVNPPYTLAQDFQELLKEVDQLLRPDAPGKVIIKTLENL
ncbi:23S rRNA (adenine(2030)-N(6))-methyltransferase RlmJ [Marinospirillum perlucidum]|uniref:23S rRNA (adenine(2030)-N(6))-methyltransferase RlmJ n=1 Tax=Marinospirillum perlucidum TaxID=1982602 RepID=UPI000DF154C5|nr:23S rRNA (adenine(2030)-N(6))-methyltransferase RlmJ [Marinospirillum perlucidum]